MLKELSVVELLRSIVGTVPPHLIHNAVFAATHWRTPFTRVIYRLVVNGRPILDDWYVWLGGVRSRTIENVLSSCFKYRGNRYVFVCGEPNSNSGDGVVRIVANRAIRIASISPILTRYILGLFRIPDRLLGVPVNRVFEERGFVVVNKSLV